MKSVIILRYNNYHKHTHYSNLRTLDVITKPIDYINKAKELSQDTYFTTEHGWGGNIWEAYDLCQQNNLKCIYGVEAYYVDDRFQKDRSNWHLIIISLNIEGYKDINRIISEANTTGYYYKPRIDKKLLLSLNPQNVIVTTACIASRLFKTENYEEEFVKPVLNYFKNHFYLEVQSHKAQAEYNKKILALHKKYDIPIIHANDSHYINEEDAKYRTMFLNAKGINYPEESEFILDYPNSKTIIDRYKEQGILNEEQSIDALKNTLIFDKCEDLKLDKEIKMPKIYKGNSNKKLKEIIVQKWKTEKELVDRDKLLKYKEAIKYEMDIIEKTHMEDYFLLDYEIVKLAKEKYNGILTRTGRGSAPSFYLNKLLGFTDIDRVDSPITLYPTRFMSITRINESKSLPDIDLNWANVDAPIKASKEILGDDGVYYMIAYKPLQDSSAFRLWCKAKGMGVSEYNEVAKDLDNYIEDGEWKNLIEESKRFRGVIESVSPSPCSMLLMDKPISQEIGLIKVGELMCCCLDGYNCDKYKYLKNDYLTVSVWSIISNVYKKLDKQIDTIKELTKKLDNKVWKLYEDGITATLNQADSDFARPLFMKYKMKSVAEASAMVAALRPGFASMLNTFINREEYTTGIKELDNLLEESYHYIMYQESCMKYLIWLGINEDLTYGIIKKISKKKFKENELTELKGTLLKNWISIVGHEEGFEKTWIIMENFSKYGFNASHSLSVGLDSLYGAYLKVNYPLEYMEVVLNQYQNDIEETSKIISELPYFNITLDSIKFKHSNASYVCEKETNKIYKGMSSIKFINSQVSEELYELRDNNYETFIDLLEDITKKTSCNSRQLEILIKLDYFNEFGKSQKLLDLLDIYNNLIDRKQIKKEQLQELNLTEELMNKYSNKKTAKMYKDIDIEGLMKELVDKVEDKDIKLKDKLKTEIELLGYASTSISSINENLVYIKKIDEFKNKKSYTYYTTVYEIKTGEEKRYRINDYKIYMEYPFKEGDIIKVCDEHKSNKKKQVDGKWIILKDEFNNMLDWYEIY